MRIAIIGFAAAGLSALRHFVELYRAHRFKVPVDIDIFDPSDQPHRGQAYSTPCRSHILNMEAEKMGLSADQPGEFTEWLTSVDHEEQQVKYPKRKNYGCYLGKLVKKVIKDGRDAGLTITVHKTTITSLSQRHKVILESPGQRYEAYDSVVLATGNWPSDVALECLGQERYLPSLWPIKALQGLPLDAHVLVLGTSLSALDATLALIEQGHKGPITMTSRRGLLPTVQSPNKPAGPPRACGPLKDLGPDSTVLDFCRALQEGRPQLRDARENLERNLNEALTRELQWRQYLNSLDLNIEDMWHKQTVQQKREFCEHWKTIWRVHRHAMPSENALRMLNVMNSGQVRVAAGFKSLHVTKQKVRAQLQGCGAIQADYAVNASGQGTKLAELVQAKRLNPLLRNLYHKGLISQHHFGALKVERHSLRLIDRQGQSQKGLYTLGHPSLGTYFYTNSVDAINRQAVTLSHQLLKQVKQSLPC